MRRLFTIGFIFCYAVAAWADQMTLTDNSIITGKVTTITADTVTIQIDEHKKETFARSRVEKILYDNGKSITFYDQLFLLDGSIIEGRVIRKTSHFIEFNPAGTVPFERISRSKISKVLYDSGEEEVFSLKSSRDLDLIFLTNGDIIKGTVHNVSSTSVRYTPSGKNKSILLPNTKVEKIEYANGKEVTFRNQTEEGPGSFDLSRLWVDLEAGWNSYVGIGPRFDYRISEHVALNAGLGVSLWGGRLSGGARYYFSYPYGFALGLGASYTTGFFKGSDRDLETVDASGAEHDEDVNLDLEPVTVLNATVLYFWQLRDNRRFYIELGYGYALDDEPYSYDSQSGNELSEDSKDRLKLYSPGGIIMSFGISVRI